MNALLKRALAEVERLPESVQESIASRILEELEDDKAWDARFAASQDALGELAQQARSEVAETGAHNFDPSDRPE